LIAQRRAETKSGEMVRHDRLLLIQEGDQASRRP
jgi:hypothetical protein